MALTKKQLTEILETYRCLINSYIRAPGATLESVFSTEDVELIQAEHHLLKDELKSLNKKEGGT